ncbi:hypothetical protein TCAL_03248, partial [Tigriopus californicus]
MFMFKDVKVDDKSDGSLLGLGEIMLLLSLTCDGLTGAVQERMKLDYQTKSGHMMTSMNKWSVFYLGIALTATGELWEFFGFVQRHPSVLYELGLFSIASALGQYFIFMCVSEFGPLPCSICTTTRKFFTVMGSVVIFGNSLMPRQWMGATLVFTGLFLDGLYGREAPKKAMILKGRFSSGNLQILRRMSFNKRRRPSNVEAIFTQGEILSGIHPVQMALKAKNRKIHQVMYNPGSKRTETLLELAFARGIPIKQVAFAELNILASQAEKKAVHQGVVADVSRLIPTDIRNEDVDTRENLWVLLCGLKDPMNVGAVIRSCYFMGVNRVICPAEYAQCPLSPVVSKASAGVLEIFPPFSISHDVQGFLHDQIQSGWDVIGSEVYSDTAQASEYHPSTKPKRILILGSEGSGMPEELEPFCQRFIHIKPGRDLDPCVDSLNVSVAAALLIEQLRHDHK